MPAARSKRRTTLGTLPLTSMIDIVFLLLIYFLVTSNFREPEKHLAARAQPEGSGAAASDLQPQVVDIVQTESGTEYRLGSRVVKDRASLESVLAALPKGPGVAVRARQDVPIKAVAIVMQACENVGITKRSYVPRDYD